GLPCTSPSSSSIESHPTTTASRSVGATSRALARARSSTWSAGVASSPAARRRAGSSTAETWTSGSRPAERRVARRAGGAGPRASRPGREPTCAWSARPRSGADGGLGAPEDGGAQDVQTHRADVERPPVEGLEVEGLPARDGLVPGGVAQLLPQPLTHLVGRRLGGPAEVAGELGGEEAPGHVRVLLEGLARVGRVPGAAAPLRGGGLAEVDADVERHARRAQALAVEHGEVVGRVVEVAEVGHEA